MRNKLTINFNVWINDYRTEVCISAKMITSPVDTDPQSIYCMYCLGISTITYYLENILQPSSAFGT